MSEVMKSSCREKDERDGMCQNNGVGVRPLEYNSVERVKLEKRHLL